MPFPFLHIFILSIAFGSHLCVTPPAEAPQDLRKSPDHKFLLKFNLHIYKYLCWAHALAELYLITVPEFVEQYRGSTIPRHINDILLPRILFGPHLDPTSIAFPPLRIFGGVLILGGGVIRWLCYRELGKHFTVDVAILKDHKLVTTGPYSIVRHPGYAGAIILYLGSLLWHGSSGAWLRESRICETKLSLLVLLPVFIMYGTVVTMVPGRMNMEDKFLRKEFGNLWNAWAKSVPFRLIPGVY